MRAQSVESHKQVRGEINESRAAFLLGLSPESLRRLSLQTGLGHRADAESGGTQLVFTYAELYRLCRLAADGAR
jgi:hypothetical protein